MLEAARVLLSNPNVHLAAPVIFLFIGGEETFSQAAHGFMQQNKRPLGVFLNLESTGPGGPDYVFQHTGSVSSSNAGSGSRAVACCITVAATTG